MSNGTYNAEIVSNNEDFVISKYNNGYCDNSKYNNFVMLICHGCYGSKLKFFCGGDWNSYRFTLLPCVTCSNKERFDYKLL